MNIVIIGFGRVGSTMARELAQAGHRIAVIEKDSSHAQRAVRLPGVAVVIGNGVDVQVQREAGVGSADLLLAVTSDDNVNLVAAEIALEVFQVVTVIARIYTPSRAEVSVSRGILTVCPTRTSLEQIRAHVEQAAGEAQPHSPPLRRPRAREPSIELADESKFVVIAGGGRVGFHLARSLLQLGHEVALIERDPQIAVQLGARIDCPVIVGDGSITATLEEAGAARSRVFAAVTGRDEDNLVACQAVKAMALDLPSQPKTIARISDPENEPLSRALGVDATVSATTLIQNMIERELFAPSDEKAPIH